MRLHHLIVACILVLIIPLPLPAANMGIMIHLLPSKTTPATTDEVPMFDIATHLTKKFTLGPLATYRTVTPTADALALLGMSYDEMLVALGGTTTITDLDALPGDTVDDDKIDAGLIATLNQDSTGYAGALKSAATTGLMTITGPGAGTTRVKTIRDANDTILEQGGSYTIGSGTWDWSTATLSLGTPSFTAVNLPSSNADPAAVSGQIKVDTVVSGFNNPAIVWSDGTNKHYIVDLTTLPSDDGYVVTYNQTAEQFEMKEGSSVTSFDELTDVDETSREFGDVYYVDSSLNLVNLHHGTDATQYLRTGGHGVAPSWATPSGAGDMSAASYPKIVAIEALTPTDSKLLVGNGTGWVAESGDTLQTSIGTYSPTHGGTGVANNSANTLTFSGAYGLTLTLSDTTSVTLPTSGTLATTAQLPTASSLHLDDLLTAVGLASEATTMGPFTGSTIEDGSTVTTALQALETAVEAASTPTLDIVGDMAADGSIGMTGYKLTLTSTLNAAGANWTLTNTTADLTADVCFFDLKYTDDGDANGYYLRGYDNSGSDLKWSIGKDGDISTTGTITSTNAASSITMGAAESTITHTGATSLAIASNTGGVSVSAKGTVTIAANGENLIFTGNANTLALSSSSSMDTLDTGTIGINLEDGFLEIPNSDDPDIATAGKISWDTDGWMRAYDGTNQVAIARKLEEIHVTVIKPNDLADAQRDAFLTWSNESGMSFVVTGWKGWSDTDDTTLNLEETDADGQNNATIDAVELATNGTGVYYGSDGTITAATIENGHLLWIDFDDTDAPGYVKMTIYGYYNADVN